MDSDMSSCSSGGAVSMSHVKKSFYAVNTRYVKRRLRVK